MDPNAFRSSQLPNLPPRSTPYRRPQPGNAGRPPQVPAGRAGQSNTTLGPGHCRPGSANQNQPPEESMPILVQLLDEIRRVREEQQKGRDGFKKVFGQLAKLDEEFRKLNDHVKKQSDTSFTVESSPYKVLIMLKTKSSFLLETHLFHHALKSLHPLATKTMFALSFTRRISPERLGLYMLTHYRDSLHNRR